jgi:hypothetical protein
MTTLTGCEIVTTKRALAVMARQTTFCFSAGVVIERLRRCHLPALWHSTSNLMAFFTSNLFMLRVIKAYAKCLC